MKPTRIVLALTLASVMTNLLAAQAAKPAAAPAKPASTAAAPTGAVANDWKQIKFPALPKFEPQVPKRIELSNGMVVFLQEDHELPLIEARFRIRGGAREVPRAKVGMAGLFGSVWRTGGTKSKTGDQLDDYLESRAAKVETGAGLDASNLSLNCLKADFKDVFNIALELLKQPEFRQDKLDLAKQQAATSIGRRNEDAGTIARREANRLLYGADSPYFNEPEYWTLAAVTRQDLLDWHKKYVHPNNMILGIVGDFDSAAMEKLVREAFESWPRGPQAQKVAADFKAPKPGVYLGEKEDVNQSNIRLVTLGIQRDDPDYYGVEVMNQAFGGGFSARLFSNVRSKKGLAYSVGGGVFSTFDHPGVTLLAIGTKSETTVKSIAALEQEMDDARGAKPFTAEELKLAKDAMLNSFIFNFDSKDKILDELMAYEFYGYPLDTLQKYRDNIEKINLDQVNRMARKYLHKEKMAIVVIGKAADFDKQPPLSSFGPVTKLNIDIPTEPPGAKSENKGPSATTPEGKALIAKVVTALGGADKISRVKTLRTKSANLMKTPQGDLNLQVTSTMRYPDSINMLISTPMGEITRVVSPDAAFMAREGQSQDLPDTQKADVARDIQRDQLNVAMHLNDPGYFFAASGTEKVGDVDTAILEVNAGGNYFRWFVDSASGHVVRAAFKANTPAGPVDRIVDFSDYRAVDGISIPYTRKTMDNGQQTYSTSIAEAEVNPAVDPSVFKKPQSPR